MLATVFAVGTTVAVMSGAPAQAVAQAPGPDTGFTSRANAVPGVAPAGAGATAVFLDLSGQVIPRTVFPASAQACTPGSGRDEPHISSTAWAVSGHGWWTKGTCTASQADVYNCLYEWYTDNSWRQKACSAHERIYAGGGSANRTDAHADCWTSDRTSWRNHVDVDVVGQSDTGEWPYTAATPPCRVY